jgi:hypothetical protein
MHGPNPTSFPEPSELLDHIGVPLERQHMPIFEHDGQVWVGLTAPRLASEPLTACQAYLQSFAGLPPTLSLREFAHKLLTDVADAAASPMLPYFPVPLDIYLKDTLNGMLAVAIHKRLLDLGRDVSHWGNPGIR